MADHPSHPLILIVDDDESTRWLAREALTRSGFAVLEACDGGEALRLQGEHRPDALLLDIVMPVLDGYAVCRRIRQRAAGSTTPILVMTTKDDLDAIEKAFAAGATDFLTKPLHLPLLAHRLRYMLRAAVAFTDARDNASRLVRAQRLAKLVHWQLHDGQFSWATDPSTIFGELQPIAVADDQPQQSHAALIALVHPDDRLRVAAVLELGQPHVLDYRMRLTDGSVRLVHQEAEDDPSGVPGSLLGATQDVTEMRFAEQEIVRLAFFDEVTRLPNREFLRRYLGRMTERSRDQNRPLTVISIELGIAALKDSLAPDDDVLLLAAADRVVEQVDPGVGPPRWLGGPIDPDGWDGDVLVARTGDDELVVVLHNIDLVLATKIGERISATLSDGFAVQESEILIAASVGLASYPSPIGDPQMAAHHARTAMRHSRELGCGGVVQFDLELERRARRRVDISRLLRRSMVRLRAGVPNCEFHLHYQPKVDPATGSIAGVEALLRWKPAGHAEISPDQFIPIAEASGLIVPLGEWVLREACAQGARWLGSGIPLRVAVNISARQLRESTFVDQVVRATAETGFSAALLELEITEHVTMHDFDHAVAVLHKLKSLGVQIALDDFGIGYSSLSYLSRLPIDTLKIDRSFILQVGKVAAAEAIPTAIIAMARSLGLRVVAEGVETIAQAEFLDREGACELQGFLFSRPIPAADLDQMMARVGRRLFAPTTHRTAARIVYGEADTTGPCAIE
jgi:EAL domain-containing protein (putative c-di-GMP-specific phosphodiesterase class I)/PleD family two-component response regulator